MDKERQKEYNRQYYLKNKERLSPLYKEYAKTYYQENKDKRASKTREYRKDPRYLMVYNAKVRAKKAGLPFDLKYHDLTVPNVCPVLGIPLEKREGKRHDGSPSIDRVHNHLGYVKGNVAIISWKANKMKSNMTLEQLKSLVEYMEGFNA